MTAALQLHDAIDAGDLTALNRLIKAGGGLNEFYLGETPLMSAVRLGRVDHVQALLQAGAKVNLVDAFGDSALHLAVSDNHPQFGVVELLVRAGADVQASGRAGLRAIDLISKRLLAFSKFRTPTEIEFRALAALGVSTGAYWGGISKLYGADPRDLQVELEEIAALLCRLSEGCSH